MKVVLIKIRNFIFLLLICFFLLSILSVIIFKWLPVPYTPLMLKRNIEQFSEGKKIKTEKKWVPLNNISVSLKLAVICSEDQNFYSHHGFDFNAIEKALKHNKNSKKIRGGSTISQQTAKNVFLFPSRTWIRKALEAYFTTLIELFWSKDRIFEVYLNIIETGKGIYGAEAASRHYFQKSANKLTVYEAASIAAILPNPLKLSPLLPNKVVNKRITFIIKSLKNLEN